MIVLFVPGRLCLFGEHSDWAGKYRSMNAAIAPGVAIVTGINQGIYASAAKCPVFRVTSEASELADVWENRGVDAFTRRKLTNWRMSFSVVISLNISTDVVRQRCIK